MSEFQTTFHRRSGSVSGARLLVLAPGNSAANIDIIMRRVPAYCVRGEIRDTNGRLVPNVVVSLEADFLSAGVINQGGRFLLTHLPAGSYTVVVSDRPRPGLVLARPAIRLAAGDITRLVITVPSPAR